MYPRGTQTPLRELPGLLPFTKIDNPEEGQDGGELIKASLIVNSPFIYIYIYIAYSIPTREGGERKCELVKQREARMEKSDLANARIVMVVCFSISRRTNIRTYTCMCVWKEGGKHRREIYGGKLRDNAIRSGQTRRIFRYLAATGNDTGFWIVDSTFFVIDSRTISSRDFLLNALSGVSLKKNWRKILSIRFSPDIFNILAIIR